MAEIVWYVFAVSAVVCGILCIVQRNPVASAMWLVGAMFALAGIYVLLNAQFIGVIQVLVYAGAIMVLFLFVIMLLNLARATSDIRRWHQIAVAAVLVAGLGAALIPLSLYTPARLAAEVTGRPAFGPAAEAIPGGTAAVEAVRDQGVVGAIAGPLFQVYLVPFEVTSILLLAAAVGAVVLAKRKI